MVEPGLVEREPLLDGTADGFRDLFDGSDESDEDENQAQDDEQQPSEGEAEEQSQGDRAEIEVTDEATDELDEGATESADAPSGELPEEAEDAESEEASESWRPPSQRGNERTGPDYKVYNPRFDEALSLFECLRRRGLSTGSSSGSLLPFIR